MRSPSWRALSTTRARGGAARTSARGRARAQPGRDPAGLLCAVARTPRVMTRSRWRAKLRGELSARFRRGSRVGRSRAGATHSLRLIFHEALLCAGGRATAERQRAGGRLLSRSRRLPTATVAPGRRRAALPLCGVLDLGREQGDGDYGEELLRSLDLSIEHNRHRRTRRARCSATATPLCAYRVRRVEQLTGRDASNARDRIEFGWRYEEGAGTLRIGVPSEIKSDEYRVAITPAGVSAGLARHEVVLLAGAAEGSDGRRAVSRRRVLGSCRMRRRCSPRRSWC